MENPKYKAKEIIESFYKFMPFKDTKLTSCDENYELIVKMEKLSAKQCALITVDEILELNVCWYDEDLVKSYPKSYKQSQTIEFWEQVKIEIQNYND